MSGNFADIIDRADLDRPALIVIGGGAADETISYGALIDLVARGAGWIASQGFERATPIGIVAGNGADFVIAMLAIAHAGMIACPINTRLPTDTIASLAKEVGLSLLLYDDSMAAMAPAGLRRAPLADLLTGKKAAVRPVADDDIFCIAFTSGSTGRPKMVPITHAGWSWGVASYGYDRARASGTRALVAAPLYHMNAQSGVFVGLHLGQTIVLMRGFEIDAFAAAIDRWRIDEITGVPTMLALLSRRIADGLPFDGGSVRTIGIGSAPLTERMLASIDTHFPGADVFNGYGTTETGIVAFGPHPGGLPTPRLSLGHPMPGVVARIGAGDDADTGVLHLRTAMMTKGYPGLPALTRERFRDGYFITNDIVRRDAHGFYWYVGRADDMFVCGGNNIDPAAIEEVVRLLPGVDQAIVVPRDDPVYGAVPVVVLTMTPGSDVTLDEVRCVVSGRVGGYARPRAVVRVEQMPLAGTQKIDRAALRTMVASLAGEPF